MIIEIPASIHEVLGLRVCNVRGAFEGREAVWPAIPVRDAIEIFRSADIERGVLTGLIQKRGPTWRALNDGGDQERDLAAQYRRFSEATDSIGSGHRRCWIGSRNTMKATVASTIRT